MWNGEVQLQEVVESGSRLYHRGLKNRRHRLSLEFVPSVFSEVLTSRLRFALREETHLWGGFLGDGELEKVEKLFQ